MPPPPLRARSLRLCAAAVTEGTLFAFVDYEDKLSAARALKALAGKSVPQLSGGWVGVGGEGRAGQASARWQPWCGTPCCTCLRMLHPPAA